MGSEASRERSVLSMKEWLITKEESRGRKDECGWQELEAERDFVGVFGKVRVAFPELETLRSEIGVHRGGEFHHFVEIVKLRLIFAHFLDEACDDFFGGHALRFCGEIGDDAMG